MPVSKICVVCSKEFSVPPSRANTAKTCSFECGGKLTAARYSEQRIHGTCEVCGKGFETPPCRTGSRKQRYCSIECSDTAKVGISRPEVEDGHKLTLNTGYVIVVARGHPFAQHRGCVFEHRLVMEEWLRSDCPGHHFLVEVGGERYLRPEIHVHHRNEIKADNRRQNLIACTSSAHKALHNGGYLLAGESWPEVPSELAVDERWKPCKCPNCGKDFLAKRSQLLRGHRAFCSRLCFETMVESGLPRRVACTCKTCGKNFSLKRSDVLGGKGSYCSIECRSKGFTGVPLRSRK